MPRLRLRSPIVTFVVLAAITAPCSTAFAQQRDRAAVAAAIDSVVASYLKDGKAAGMSVALVKGRDTLVMKGYGSADLELDVPTPPRAIYEIGSVTKQFTAAAIMQLQSEGKVHLDDELTKYFPDYPVQGHHITLQRLLDHTSGIKGYTELPAFGSIMSRKLPKDSLVALFRNQPFDFAPGDAMVYNNSAYFLAGLIIEKVSGMSYAEYVKQHLFAPAGMPDSRYCSETEITKRKMHGYDTGPTGLQLKGYIVHTYPFSAGSLCSTVGDLVAWNRALHGGKILSPEAYKEFMTPGRLNDGTTLRYAKGLTTHTLAGHRVVEHGGGINGFLSESAWLPDDDAIVVVLINTAGPVSPNAVAASLVEVSLGRIERPVVTFTGDRQSLAGTYRGIGRGNQMTMQVAVNGDKLTATMPPTGKAAELRFIGNDTWELDDNQFTFVRDNGKVSAVRADLIYGYSVLARQP